MTFEKISLGIIGVGRWGKNHLRTASNLLGPDQIKVFDPSDEARKILEEINPDVEMFNSLDKILNDADINSVVVSTPAVTHFKITKQCLLAGKNVLVEKPISLEVSEAEQLVDIAAERNLKLMVGHVLLYHPAVIKMKEQLDLGVIGQLQYIYSNRLNLGAIRSEENILWSFAPHDISVIQYLTGNNPVNVKAHGATFVQNGIEDTTLTYLEYPQNIKAHIFVSWLNPFKEQRMVVIGDKGMFVFEDSIKDEKLKLYKKGFKVTNGQVEKFDEEYSVIEFEPSMPLTEEHKHFYQCVLNNQIPITDGNHALEVLKILDQATSELNK